jgi:hypothetical protein
MRTLARSLAGLGLATAGLVIWQSPALATAEPSAGSVQAATEVAVHVPAQLPECGPGNSGQLIVDGDDLLECVKDPSDPIDPWGWSPY